MNESPRRWLMRDLFSHRKLIALLFLVALIAAYLYRPTEEELRSHQERWKAAVEDDPWLWAGVFFAAEVVLLGLSVPVASGSMIVCGFLFGRWRAALIISASAPIGALLAMLASRYLFRGAVRRVAARRPRLERWVEFADAGIEREGWYYLLLLRLTPVIPFFVINLVMGLTRIRPWTYFWVTTVGMIPATLVFVNAGATAAEIRSANDLVSAETILALMLLVLVPIVLRFMLPKSRAGYPV
jgi:uncharacterized membrane protein YdjX (TVP38/TMEM64 family)